MEKVTIDHCKSTNNSNLGDIWTISHGKVTEFRDGNGKLPKNLLIH